MNLVDRERGSQDEESLVLLVLHLLKNLSENALSFIPKIILLLQMADLFLTISLQKFDFLIFQRLNFKWKTCHLLSHNLIWHFKLKLNFQLVDQYNAEKLENTFASCYQVHIIFKIFLGHLSFTQFLTSLAAFLKFFPLLGLKLIFRGEKALELSFLTLILFLHQNLEGSHKLAFCWVGCLLLEPSQDHLSN